MKRNDRIFTKTLLLFTTGLILAGCWSGKQVSPTPTAIGSLTLVATTSSLEIQTTTLPTISAAITEQEYRERWLIHPPCPPPCWEGLTPGKTTAKEAVTILESNPLFTNVALWESPILNDKTGSVLWDFAINGEIFGNEARFSTETEDQIIFMINPWTPLVTLGKLIDAFGEPSHIIASVTPPIHPEDVESWAVYVVWLSKGITFLTVGSVPFPVIDEKFTSNGLQYFTPRLEDYVKLVNPDLIKQMKPWRGYGPFEMYYTPETGP